MQKYKINKTKLATSEVGNYKDFNALLTTYKRSRQVNFWTWILPLSALVLAGMYFIPKALEETVPVQNTTIEASGVSKQSSAPLEVAPAELPATDEVASLTTDTETKPSPKNEEVPPALAADPDQSKSQTKAVPTFVEAAPLGGYDVLYAFFSENLLYPSEAKANKITGSVVVAFNVDSIGNVNDIRVLQSLENSLDAEAIRLVGAMPPWSPALLKGDPIETRLSIPIHFDLIEENE